ncbi:MAG: hypothetical protein GF320_04205 [Armatimonadia bacterium]|nr:hypothetical protein [Armatimonadia bacterium]
MQFNEIQLDALREIGNIGAGNAATALSELIQTKVDITVPEVRVIETTKIPDMVGGPEREVVACLFGLSGGLEGAAMYVFPLEEAKYLSDRMLQQPEGTTTEMGEMEQSVIGEVGNILTGSYMTAMQGFTGIASNLSPPAVTVSQAMVIFSEASVIASTFADWTIWVETDFIVEEGHLKAYLFLLASPEAMEQVLTSLGVG